MTTHVIVFGPHVPGDAALDSARWYAEQHAEKLGETALLLPASDAVRTILEELLRDTSVEGVVLCGHGDGGKLVYLQDNPLHLHRDREDEWRMDFDNTSEEGAVFGTDRAAALNVDNIALTAGRWVHAMACLVARSPLPHRAVERGAVAFAAYEESLTPEFTTSQLPAELHDRLARVATTASMMLAKGCRVELTIQQAVQESALEVLEWLNDSEGFAWQTAQEGWREVVGLTKFAKQLSSALRIVCAP